MITVISYAKASGYRYSSITSRLNKDPKAPRPLKVEEVKGLCHRRFYDEDELNRYFKMYPIKEWGQ